MLNNLFKAWPSIPCVKRLREKAVATIIAKDKVISLSTKGTGEVTMKNL